MKFSFKKKDEEFFTLLEQEDIKTISTEKNNKTVSHNALTPDEVIMGFGKENTSNVKETGALDNLKKRIVNAAENKEVAEVKAEAVIKPTEIPFIPEIKTEEAKATETPKTSEKPSLLDKCGAYIRDEDGKKADLNAEPLYKLQSVAEILRSDSEKAVERLSKKYDVSFDDLGHNLYTEPFPEKKNQPEIKPEIKTTHIAETPISKAYSEPKEIFEEIIPLKNAQSSVKSIISDIDIPPVQTTADTPKELGNTATITFTPVSDADNGSAHLAVSSRTRPIDLTGELEKLPEVSEDYEELQLEKNEFEDFVPDEELEGNKNAGKLIRKFSIIKRNNFLITFISILFTIALAVTKLPFMSQVISTNTRTVMIICSIITGVIICVNAEMLLSLKNIFKRSSNADVSATLASLTVIAYAVYGIITNNIITDMLLLLAVILSFRSLTVYYKSSYMLSNLRLVSGNTQKTALRLIDDNAVTFAMAKNAIEGDVLIATPQKTEQLADFIKYSTFGTFFGGKLPVVTVISVILSVILGFTCSSYFDGIIYGLYAAAAIQCFTALPVSFYIETLPLYRASKRLKRKGGMIAGKTAAEYIEMANAVVINSADLFPAGTVTLHQMQVLSENNLEDTLVRAASLTEALGSSLAPIFKKIAGTGNITVLPDSDTVKYEDRMGISGWVDNRLLFIGNRTLMEAHSIEVPSVEVDRKILRQGYFPVYVATREKACALLIIQYNVNRNIAHELRKLTASGVTLLVNSCDPNLIEEMICDYFGLYNDSVKVMSAAGCHMYKNAVAPLKTVSAPAMFKGNSLALPLILNCAAKIKKSNILLTVMYVLSVVLGTVIFAYTSLSGSGELIREATLLIYGVISTALSYLLYLFVRP